jgi:hypothetical protein
MPADTLRQAFTVDAFAGFTLAILLLFAGKGLTQRAAVLAVGVRHKDEARTRLDDHGMLFALLWLNLALVPGNGSSALIARTGLNLPGFVASAPVSAASRWARQLLGTRWTSSSPRAKAVMLSMVVCMICPIASCVKKAWWPVTITLGKDTRRWITSSVMTVEERSWKNRLASCS